MSEEDKRRKASWKRLKGTTNFYPTYVDGNLDKVTPAKKKKIRTDFWE